MQLQTREKRRAAGERNLPLRLFVLIMYFYFMTSKKYKSARTMPMTR